MSYLLLTHSCSFLKVWKMLVILSLNSVSHFAKLTLRAFSWMNEWMYVRNEKFDNRIMIMYFSFLAQMLLRIIFIIFFQVSSVHHAMLNFFYFLNWFECRQWQRGVTRVRHVIMSSFFEFLIIYLLLLMIPFLNGFDYFLFSKIDSFVFLNLIATKTFEYWFDDVSDFTSLIVFNFLYVL